MRLTAVLVLMIGCAGCQNPVETSSEQANEERTATAIVTFGELQGATEPRDDNMPAGLAAGRQQVFPQTLPEFDRADLETLRLPPDAFVDLPAAVVADLEQRGCTIPQVWPGVEQSNVVRGRFTRSDQADIAVLCSRDRVSSILIFRRGSANDVVELAQAPDRGYLQGMGGGIIGFSRSLGVVDSEYIREHHEAYGGREPPTVLDHDGINDAFVGKASMVWHWYAGEWLELTGAD